MQQGRRQTNKTSKQYYVRKQVSDLDPICISWAPPHAEESVLAQGEGSDEAGDDLDETIEDAEHDVGGRKSGGKTELKEEHRGDSDPANIAVCYG